MTLDLGYSTITTLADLAPLKGLQSLELNLDESKITPSGNHSRVYSFSASR